MRSEAATVAAYLDELPADRRAAVERLRKEILDNLPPGFAEVMNYGMIGYVVPHSIYPAGYHCDTEQPLPFMNLASQKNYIAVYHMGVYAIPEILNWFQTSYKALVGSKPDMGKSCIRFKKIEKIPCELIGELSGKITVAEWIEFYEKSVKR